MMFLESRNRIEELVSSCLDKETGDEILRRSVPAIAFLAVEEETQSWMYGNARLGEGVEWPSVNGRALQHTARIRLDGLPKVLPQQPESGYLSFFDGYAWAEEADWDLSDYGFVTYDNGHSVSERVGPDIPTEYFEAVAPQFVVADGPYWTIPPHEEIASATTDLDHQALTEFSRALSENCVDGPHHGQLLGWPNPIQNDITPEPKADQSSNGDGWVHLASFSQTGGIFDYYYAVRLRELANRSLDHVVFDAQCG